MRKLAINTLLAAMLAAGLGACSVGPDYRTPVPALPEAWPTATGITPVDRQWWRQMNDPQLASLVERAAQANLDVRSASIRLAQSQALRQVSGAQQLPGIATTGGYRHRRNSADGLLDSSGLEGQAPFELWDAAMDASWEIDLWGHVRRSLEAADAQIQLSQAQQAGVLLSISAETARNYIQLRAVQAQLGVSEQNLALARQSRDLVQTRFDNGVTTHLDIANAAAQVATFEARVPVLQAQQERLVNALSYLLGLAPGALRAELQTPAPIPAPSTPVPLGVPSELAQRRPDIQQSEAALHQATAAIGVAEADFYPRVSLGASFGFETTHGADLGAWNSRQWSFGPSLYLPVFQGGRLTGTLQLRQHQQQAAAIEYQRTVLGAWHEVANALSDYAAEQQHQQALAEAAHQNDLALAAARERYRQGATDFINVLGVQRALLETQSALVNSQAQSALDRVQLYRALGGGWPSA